METNAAIAFNRFGLGRRRGQPVPSDPRAALLSQLSAPDSASTAGLPSTADAMQLLLNLNRAKVAAKQAGADPRDTPEAQAYRAHIDAETAAFLAQAITTPDGFRERLVWFWFNHFTVAARNVVASGAIGPYIREAIRPHVTGSFPDMLLAVMRHPAMLAYLDQQTSVGPDSIIGQRRNRGLNENLARECLELHTVTPTAGYTQQDVTAFARILTGWTWDRSGPPFAFMFQPNAHEPGEQVVLGRTWPDGEQGGLLLLDYLANHPATHHHLAEKLVRHFVADDPPPADVARIEQVLRDTKGNLGAAAAAVVMLPGAWSPPLSKLRSPMDYVVAVMRAVGAEPAKEPHVPGVLHGLGQPLFNSPFPIGWPDRAVDWSNPEAIVQRVDFAYQFAGRVNDQEPADIAEATLGPLLTGDADQAIRRAGSRREALTLLLASPEFQRR